MKEKVYKAQTRKRLCVNTVRLTMTTSTRKYSTHKRKKENEQKKKRSKRIFRNGTNIESRHVYP